MSNAGENWRMNFKDGGVGTFHIAYEEDDCLFLLPYEADRGGVIIGHPVPYQKKEVDLLERLPNDLTK